MKARTHCSALNASIALTLFTASAAAQSIAVDHDAVDASVLSSDAVNAARGLSMSFSHASVGVNIWNGLVALAAGDERYAIPDRWTENNRGNPGWSEKISEFEQWVATHDGEYAVFQNKFCYIDQAASFDAYRDSMVALADEYPDAVFVWWTMPLMDEASSDNALRVAFNEQVREYCAENELVLFDIADIESHAEDGTPCQDAISNGEDAMAVLCGEYTTDGGHLTGRGAARMANAMWVLMAELATGGSAVETDPTDIGGNPDDVSPSAGAGGDSGTDNSEATGGADATDSTQVTGDADPADERDPTDAPGVADATGGATADSSDADLEASSGQASGSDSAASQSGDGEDAASTDSESSVSSDEAPPEVPASSEDDDASAEESSDGSTDSGNSKSGCQLSPASNPLSSGAGLASLLMGLVLARWRRRRTEH